jgi:alcohol dehydrogenase
MTPFEFQPRTRIVFGPGTVARLGELAGELAARRVLLISDAGVVAAGHAQRGLESVRDSGLQVHLYDQVQENPTTDDVERGVAIARDLQPDLLVGLGGGSSMDCAKGINFVYTNGGRMQDYWGEGKATQMMLPMIAVPTTAGTGSEAQSFALISDAQTHVKMACGDEKAACPIAILDPELTLTQPPRVTALTGIDAIAHALETYVTKRRNPISQAFSREAWRLLSTHFARVLDDPQNVESRGAMQLGACFAGLAIENSMLGATHALANPLTATYEIPHGQAIAAMLPHVLQFNGRDVAESYQELEMLTPEADPAAPASQAVERLSRLVAQWVQRSGLPSTLKVQGVAHDMLPWLASDAARQWTAGFNPRPVREEDLLGLYQNAFE